MTRSGNGMRPWIVWLIAGIWIATLIVVFIVARIHPSTVISATLNVQEISLKTDAAKILEPLDEEQLLITGMAKLTIEGSGLQLFRANGASVKANAFELTGQSSSACTFYAVRSSGIALNEQSSQLSLLKPNVNSEGSFALKSHGSLSGTLTSQSSSENLHSGFSCTRISVNGSPPDTVEGMLPSAGSSLYFYTAPDARIDFRVEPGSFPRDTQIRIINPLRFSHVGPGPNPEEKTVLLQAPQGEKNEVVFEGLDKTLTLDEADLLVIVPESDFYVKQFTARQGIQLMLHGRVSEVRLGAGSADLQNSMPSLFDHLNKQKRIYGVIPGIVALIIGILEKMRILPR